MNVTLSAGFVPLPFAHLDETEFGWERAVQLADAALYLSKMRGRNQVYGVIGLARPYAEIAAEFERDFALAREQHWVRLLHINGPTIPAS